MKAKCVVVNMFILLFVSCVPGIDSQQEKAKQVFIEKSQYMTEREALSSEINYYKSPEITVSRHIRSLTGKDLIHECNIVIKKETDDMRGKAVMGVIRESPIHDIKDFAIEHPDDVVANEYYFEGIFTHYNNGYNTHKAYVIYIPKFDQYIMNDRVVYR